MGGCCSTRPTIERADEWRPLRGRGPRYFWAVKAGGGAPAAKRPSRGPKVYGFGQRKGGPWTAPRPRSRTKDKGAGAGAWALGPQGGPSLYQAHDNDRGRRGVPLSRRKRTTMEEARRVSPLVARLGRSVWGYGGRTAKGGRRGRRLSGLNLSQIVCAVFLRLLGGHRPKK